MGNDVFVAADWYGDEILAVVVGGSLLSVDIHEHADSSPAANVELKLDQAEAFANWILKEVENARRVQQQ